MGGALDKLHVLDFSRILAGPFATMQLADLGATVIKVERPVIGDDTRRWGPPFDDHGQATYFQTVNRNKDTIILDLNDRRDRSEARRLATWVDIVVENFRPGLMTKFGLDYEQLKPENDGLIYCSITGFGRGLGAELPGYDLLIQALGGLMSITGTPQGEPQKVGVAVVDVLAGLFATTGILAALHHRSATGKGQRIDIDLLSCLLAGLANQATAYTSAGVVPSRMGNQHPSIAPYELFACADRELVLAVGNDRQFAALCEALGAPSLAATDQFATNPARVRHRQQLRAELERLLATRTAADWMKVLTEVRVPVGVVNDIAGAFALADNLGLDPIVAVPRHDGSTVSLCRNPINLSATPPVYRCAPPELPVPTVP
ncbi:carnitine dehydratase [Mycobacterium triplex]|uniref:Carnitine dehydratase n=1 Tax=Mycobacterium triplex TaxID=47839 RepID=A0A024JSH2_9MYCO|nr:CoA transferase [Mycobacterium triplex]ORW99097.1 carnitine dehydratase [Mycobacterium triplex]CDO86163.1 putative L-carnitine dehydratase [Mycobacterium triplex]